MFEAIHSTKLLWVPLYEVILIFVFSFVANIVALQANVVGWCFASAIELVFLVLPKPYDCNFVCVLSRDKSSLATLLIIHAGGNWKGGHFFFPE